jgi:hypothetical protein
MSEIINSIGNVLEIRSRPRESFNLRIEYFSDEARTIEANLSGKTFVFELYESYAPVLLHSLPVTPIGNKIEIKYDEESYWLRRGRQTYRFALMVSEYEDRFAHYYGVWKLLFDTQGVYINGSNFDILTPSQNLFTKVNGFFLNQPA